MSCRELTQAARFVVLLVLGLTVSACVKPVPPAPAEIRRTAPPWAAPRDGVSYIEAAGLEQLPLDITDGQRIVRMQVVVDGTTVAIPAYVGVDRLRAVQAAVHTHDDTGTVYLEGGSGTTPTLGQFFTLWGVHLDENCVGAACGRLTVRAETGLHRGDPRSLGLGDVSTVSVAVDTR